MPNIMTYEEWLKANPDLEEQEGEECHWCNGDGRCLCGYCEGTGKEGGKSLRDMYKEQVNKDKALLAKSPIATYQETR